MVFGCSAWSARVSGVIAVQVGACQCSAWVPADMVWWLGTTNKQQELVKFIWPA